MSESSTGAFPASGHESSGALDSSSLLLLVGLFIMGRDAISTTALRSLPRRCPLGHGRWEKQPKKKQGHETLLVPRVITRRRKYKAHRARRDARRLHRRGNMFKPMLKRLAGGSNTRARPYMKGSLHDGRDDASPSVCLQNPRV